MITLCCKIKDISIIILKGSVAEVSYFILCCLKMTDIFSGPHYGKYILCSWTNCTPLCVISHNMACSTKRLAACQF